MTTDTPDLSQRISIATAALLACGLHLDPRQPQSWPSGFRNAWNDANAAGWFEDCRTVGDMARQFLLAQLDRLDAQES